MAHGIFKLRPYSHTLHLPKLPSPPLACSRVKGALPALRVPHCEDLLAEPHLEHLASGKPAFGVREPGRPPRHAYRAEIVRHERRGRSLPLPAGVARAHTEQVVELLRVRLQVKELQLHASVKPARRLKSRTPDGTLCTAARGSTAVSDPLQQAPARASSGRVTRRQPTRPLLARAADVAAFARTMRARSRQLPTTAIASAALCA
eukprot:scaffold79375_cov75-Phaeocystis_antarctica.AAC.2